MSLASEHSNFFISSNEKSKEKIEASLKELNKQFTLKDLNSASKISDDDNLLLLGGDGSINYLLNHFPIEVISKLKVIYFPCGTANDFARSLKLSFSEPFPHKIESILEGSPLLSIPIMKCNDRFFINVISGGSPAQVTDSGDGLLKKVAGKMSYFVNSLDKIISNEDYNFSFQTEEEEEKSKINSPGFLISQGLYAGGGVRTTSSFSPNFNKKFNFIYAHDKDVAQLLKDLINMQNSDNPPDLYTNAIKSLFCEKLIIRSDQEIPLKLDGEEYQAKVLEVSKSEYSLKFYIY